MHHSIVLLKYLFLFLHLNIVHFLRHLFHNIYHYLQILLLLFLHYLLLLFLYLLRFYLHIFSVLLFLYCHICCFLLSGLLMCLLFLFLRLFVPFLLILLLYLLAARGPNVSIPMPASISSIITVIIKLINVIPLFCIYFFIFSSYFLGSMAMFPLPFIIHHSLFTAPKGRKNPTHLGCGS